jgi:hypothetical protein
MMRWYFSAPSPVRTDMRCSSGAGRYFAAL